MIIDPSTEDPTSQSPNASTRTYVRDAKAMASTPADVKEYPNSYIFIIDMPGLKSRDIKVTVEDENVLVISGERKREEAKEGEKYVRMERRIGKFMRKFVLPENANIDKISAVCEDGVLSVSVEKLPPPEPKKPKTIEVPSQDPWFFMVNPCFQQSIAFDTTERNWKNLNDPLLLQQKHNYNSIPVTSSGGQLPPLHPSAQAQTLHAISMSTSSKSSSSYTLILVFGDFPNFTTKVFQSGKDCWDEETMLSKTTDDSTESDIVVDETLYFLSKAGDVVTTNMQRSPSKQYSSVTTVDNREDIVLLAL
ncbi:hypothetical protein GIB67_006021 [Kingdonia uniflora]|uniref:SHSP domain-containing protein n=1 Tax=Kingdonia uniflora TaxID=39325 RepID=A0A7J7MBV9_9MAGN|nr:hypothetical protein GIB67_006021 [Kingdonia uniflora]